MTRNTYIRCGAAVVTVILAGWTVNWLIAPSNAELVTEGRALFLHEWTVNDELAAEGDGLGPVFNARSCVACHFQGGVGGGGSIDNNVTAFQVFPNREDSQFYAGVIHAEATTVEFRETVENVHRIYPVIPESTRVVSGCSITIEPFDPVLVEHINTPALYGAGSIDRISAFAIKTSRRGRLLDGIADDFNLRFDAPVPGKLRTHGFDGVGKFGWRGQFATLEDFVATACAVELGLTNPQRAQDLPLRHVPDDDAQFDMTSRQLEALVTYCRNLPRPKQVLPTNAGQLQTVNTGEHIFLEIGCADCHQPDIGGIEGVYSDFLLYSLEPREQSNGYGVSRTPEVALPHNVQNPDEWQTPPLWGVADSAPYFHDGAAATLEDAIARHDGEASKVLQRHTQLKPRDRRQLIAFLKSLRAPLSAEPVQHQSTLDDPSSLSAHTR